MRITLNKKGGSIYKNISARTYVQHLMEDPYLNSLRNQDYYKGKDKAFIKEHKGQKHTFEEWDDMYANFQFNEKKQWGGHFRPPQREVFYKLFQDLEQDNIKDHNPYVLQRLNKNTKDWHTYIPLNPKKNNGATWASVKMSAATDANGNVVVFPFITKNKRGKLKDYSKKRDWRKGFDRAIKNNDYIKAGESWNNLPQNFKNSLLTIYADNHYKELHQPYMESMQNIVDKDRSMVYGGGISGIPLMSVQEFLKYSLDTDPVFKENFYTNKDNLMDLWSNFIQNNFDQELPLEMWNEKMGWN